jgi:ATP-dependent DNA helicase RecG
MNAKQLDELLARKENEHLECKEAKNNYHFEKLVEYCAALANEGGGKMILGVTDHVPHKVVGTTTFQNLERTKAGLVERLKFIRVSVDEIAHPGGRVLVFDVPSRPLGLPIDVKGAYLMRAGEDLVPMTQDMLQSIFAEGTPDYSAEICANASMADLETEAITRFRQMWIRKSGNSKLAELDDGALLEDAELVVDGNVTYAALVLLGSRTALGKFLAHAEIVFEYRSSEASLPSQIRKEFREAVFLFYDKLWAEINLRNEVQQYQDELFVWDIPTFDEAVVREAIQNAVCHRDYKLAGSIFIRQFPKKLEIISPGGFPPGVTTENILWKQMPRNRRIAEAFAKCGLVERSGQGANRMFEQSIKQSKPLPDFAGTDNYQVALTIRGEVQDPLFLRFLEKVGHDMVSRFTTQDLLILDLIHKERPIPEMLKERLPNLRDLGIIETTGRGRATINILSRKLYSFIGKGGVYTRKKGLDQRTNKALLLEHLKDVKSCGRGDLEQVLPHLSKDQLKWLLDGLRHEGKIKLEGSRRWAKWHFVSDK